MNVLTVRIPHLSDEASSVSLNTVPEGGPQTSMHSVLHFTNYPISNGSL